MTSEKGGRKDKNQNIQVFVRVRPINQRERDIKSLGVVEVVNNREVVVRQSQSTSHTKKFTFDRAFGPHAKQLEIYQDVVSPLIEEVLAGYNCTVFAYGQTGTGKTHTMVGEHTGENTTWQNDPLSGIIPRALSQLFDELRLSNTEYTVRVSYLELYNEELFDLLSGSEDNSKLRIYEDVTRKGSNIVNGLEEITVYNKNEVYKIMTQGQDRKRVASTLMNAQSSRSHTVFTIVVHMKENSPEGEELVKIGKLNLVDLAGSENISKAGSDNPAKRERARECVNINQSLLTLGRVITALVERHPHIPYRESKLTRILQESLGGRTKTSIIATVSPGHKDLEETMSTLEYANRAKNIQNKPEVNQKMTKKAILKEYAEEIDRLKRDLAAARDKNGVYLATETFAEITLNQEQQKKEIQELLLHKRAVEEERDKMEGVFSELKCKLQERESELQHTRRQLDSTADRLETTSHALQTTKLHLSEQTHLLSKQQATEQQLSSQAKQLLSVADTASEHVAKLQQAVETRKLLESQNLQLTQAYREESEQRRHDITRELDSLVEELTATHADLENLTESHVSGNVETYGQHKLTLDEIAQQMADALSEIRQLTATTHASLSTQTAQQRAALQQTLQSRGAAARLVARRLAAAAAGAGARARAAAQRAGGELAGWVDQWHAGSNERVTSLRGAQASLLTSWRAGAARRLQGARRHGDARRAQAERRVAAVAAGLTEITAESSKLDERLTQKVKEIDREREQNEERLQQWVREERELFERRIARHVEQQRKFTEESLEKKLKEIEVERSLLEKLTAEGERLRELQTQLSGEEMEYEAETLRESESGHQETETQLTRFETVFDHGASAITADMQALSENVLRVVEHVQQQALSELQAAEEDVQRGVTEVETAEGQSARQFAEAMDGVFDTVVGGSRQAMDSVVGCVESLTSSTHTRLSCLAPAPLLTAAAAHLASHGAALQRAAAAAARAREGVRRGARGQAHAERKYLEQEYRVYAASGSTPARQEYRYPRALAATSPHERILARFRAVRQHSADDDCIIVDSGASSRRNSTSSLSEDSAVFAAPSPPAPAPPAAAPAPIVKCISETDIYTLRKQQGKENEQNQGFQSLQKRSKLRAPSSLKKPLVERNTPS